MTYPTRPSLRERWQARARALAQEVDTLYLAYRDPRTPWSARLFAALVVGYALSPIDLIPDFIPVLGYLDDLLLIPLGIKLALKMIPEDVLRDSRVLAKERALVRPPSRAAAVVIVLVWLAAAVFLLWLVRRFLA